MGFSELLAKPFTMEGLGEAVTRALKSQKPAPKNNGLDAA